MFENVKQMDGDGHMKIYIVGSVASGKSTLARQLSAKSGIPCFHLDEVVRFKDPNGEFGNTKRSPEEREALFQKILSADCIIEDTGRACFEEGLRRADRIIVLDLPRALRHRRIILRHIKQVLGIEKSSYTPSLEMVRLMFKWADDFDTGADGVKARIAPFRDKTMTLRSKKDVQKFLEEF